MGVGVVIAVGDVPGNETVVEVGLVGLYVGGEALDDVSVEVDVGEDDDVEGLRLEL